MADIRYGTFAKEKATLKCDHCGQTFQDDHCIAIQGKPYLGKTQMLFMHQRCGKAFAETLVTDIEEEITSYVKGRMS